ncbi:MAG: class II aldolase/adducin family protein [Bacteroidetes bacterium]|nr:class II aldolase/adducin family protein [Bacteroidota bacterium]
MELLAHKQNLIKVCRKLAEHGFVAATDGNVSIRLDDGTILVTPSGRSKADVDEDELIVVGLDGRVVAGIGRSSTEFGMHSLIYQKRPDIRGIVHAHPVHATAFAAARIALDKPIFPEVIVALGKIPLASYSTPSTAEVSEAIEPLVEEFDAILLANHGVVTCGSTLDEAYDKMEKVEHTAAINFIVMQMGGAKELTKEEVQRLASISERSYGKKVDLKKIYG